MDNGHAITYRKQFEDSWQKMKEDYWVQIITVNNIEHTWIL